MALFKYKVLAPDGFDSHDIRNGGTVLETVPTKNVDEYTRNFDDTVQLDIDCMVLLDICTYWDEATNTNKLLYTKEAV